MIIFLLFLLYYITVNPVTKTNGIATSIKHVIPVIINKTVTNVVNVYIVKDVTENLNIFKKPLYVPAVM